MPRKGKAPSQEGPACPGHSSPAAAARRADGRPGAHNHARDHRDTYWDPSARLERVKALEREWGRSLGRGGALPRLRRLGNSLPSRQGAAESDSLHRRREGCKRTAHPPHADRSDACGAAPLRIQNNMIVLPRLSQLSHPGEAVVAFSDPSFRISRSILSNAATAAGLAGTRSRNASDALRRAVRRP